MGFYHRLTLALAIICLFAHGGLVSTGAPAEGRYMFVKCRPEDKDANCVTHKGPVIPLKGNSPRLPPSAVKDISPVITEEATPEMEEQSGEGSGNSEIVFLGDAPQKEINKNEEEGSAEASGDIDYSNYVFPEKIEKLSSMDLKEENMIP